MTDALAFDDACWQVPSHDVVTYGEKAYKYALVIPVINEGDRIRGQLSRIKDAQLNVDVIVADGGSTDGSLDAEFVEPIGVRAVLTKTGPGKLSAQLRMAYAWCLREGYAGIITIDGNGKDGVEAIAGFVEKLDQGCDYVQGSRYLPGGEAENTPLERTIANRLIHAPILSVAGRHRFTDTTNGFRAYSARYLTHPEVRPFRGQFEVYSLLFYLTIRAGQLGLKVDHVPVIRRYPDSGKVPTKIGGFGSKLALLGETVKAATGGYTPDSASVKSDSLGWPALITAAILLPLLLTIITAPDYSSDSWALYELSKTVFSDFFRFSHFRSFSNASEYSSAFAPLWPTLIAVADGLLGTGARTGLYLAFLCYFAFSLVSERIGQILTGARWIGITMAIILLLGPSMVWGELGAGRTIPLQLLIYALVLMGLLSGSTAGFLRAGAIGFVAGLAVMNRFDAVFLPVLVALMLLWITRSPTKALIALGSTSLAILPWAAYSLITFGTVFATDNSAIATTLDPRAFVTDWWPQAQPDWSDNPAAWATKIIGHLRQWTVNGLSLLLTPLGACAGLMAAIVGGVQFLCNKAPTWGPKVSPPGQLWLMAGFALILAGMMLPQIITGYLEYRYYSALCWAAFMALATWLIAFGVTQRQRQFYADCCASVGALGIAIFIGLQVAPAATAHPTTGTHTAPQSNWLQFEKPSDLAALGRCIGDDKDARILVIGDDEFAAKAGALGSFRTMMEPRNMAEGRLDQAARDAFIETWDVKYILNRRSQSADRNDDFRGFQPVSGCAEPLLKRAR